MGISASAHHPLPYVRPQLRRVPVAQLPLHKDGIERLDYSALAGLLNRASLEPDKHVSAHPAPSVSAAVQVAHLRSFTTTGEVVGRGLPLRSL
ncbi:hypothetical protein NDI52_27460 [Leptolyngbya sp. PL-A3]|uniref:hypothetical protein n=1 Tax=Leptolyngbya sp. PL-A3 TaxID=2933911 RepID=UPI003299903A